LHIAVCENSFRQALRDFASLRDKLKSLGSKGGIFSEHYHLPWHGKKHSSRFGASLKELTGVYEFVILLTLFLRFAPPGIITLCVHFAFERVHTIDRHFSFSRDHLALHLLTEGATCGKRHHTQEEQCAGEGRFHICDRSVSNLRTNFCKGVENDMMERLAFHSITLIPCGTL
jgi:hypothetical protein